MTEQQIRGLFKDYEKELVEYGEDPDSVHQEMSSAMITAMNFLYKGYVADLEAYIAIYEEILLKKRVRV